MNERYIVAIDPGSDNNLGFSILSWEGTDIKVMMMHTLNMKSKSDMADLKTIISGGSNGTSYTFEGVCYESNPFGRTITQLAQRQTIGFIKGVAMMAGIPDLGGIHSSHVKAVMGNGRMSKEQMMRTVELRFNLMNPVDEHQADAVACGVAMIHQLHRAELMKQQTKLRGTGKLKKEQK